MFVRNGWCEPRHGTNPDKALNTRAAGGIGCSHLCRSCCCSKLHSCLVFDVYLVIPFHLLLFVGQAVMISNFHLLMLKSNCALLHAAMSDMTAQGEYRVRLFLGKKKIYKNVSCQQQFMCFDHRSRLGMLQSVNNNVLCPFYTSESNAKWPYVSV